MTQAASRLGSYALRTRPPAFRRWTVSLRWLAWTVELELRHGSGRENVDGARSTGSISALSDVGPDCCSG